MIKIICNFQGELYNLIKTVAFHGSQLLRKKK